MEAGLVDNVCELLNLMSSCMEERNMWIELVGNGSLGVSQREPG